MGTNSTVGYVSGAFDVLYTTASWTSPQDLHSMQMRIDSGEDVDVGRELVRPTSKTWEVTYTGGGAGSVIVGSSGASGTNGVGPITGITSV
jgi:hypothetical protein